MDSEYLNEVLGECLAEGLTAVALQRPEDPIRFLAHWLRYYDETENKKQETKEHSESEAPAETPAEAAEEKMSGEEEKPSTPDPENQETAETTVEHAEGKPEQGPNPDPTEVMEGDQDEGKVVGAAERDEPEQTDQLQPTSRQDVADLKWNDAENDPDNESDAQRDEKVDDEETVKPEGSAEPEAAGSDSLNPEQTFPHQGTEEDVQETEQPSSPVLQNQEQEADGQATSELDFSSASAEGDSSPE